MLHLRDCSQVFGMCAPKLIVLAPLQQGKWKFDYERRRKRPELLLLLPAALKPHSCIAGLLKLLLRAFSDVSSSSRGGVELVQRCALRRPTLKNPLLPKLTRFQINLLKRVLDHRKIGIVQMFDKKVYSLLIFSKHPSVYFHFIHQNIFGLKIQIIFSFWYFASKASYV